MKKTISAKNLTKKYGKLTAVNGISFEVYKGEIFGLLGENGAGKTTTLEMLEGLRKPSSGEISVLECNLEKELECIKEQIGVQLQSSAYYSFLTLQEILELFGSFYNKRLDPLELLKMVELEEKANSYVGSLSGGQKQRFSIVASLVNDPELVFLDEPTTGLDPLARRNLWNLISKIKSQGKTIILTTHYMEEAEVLCDRIAIMEKGKILAMDDTHKLMDQAEYPFTINFVKENVTEATIKKLQKLGKVENLFGKNNHFIIKMKEKKDSEDAIKIVEGINPETVTSGRATLEDLFIELTGKTIED
jgi:ABC-2 type transport system ATP-binding protein